MGGYWSLVFRTPKLGERVAPERRGRREVVRVGNLGQDPAGWRWTEPGGRGGQQENFFCACGCILDELGVVFTLKVGTTYWVQTGTKTGSICSCTFQKLGRSM